MRVLALFLLVVVGGCAQTFSRVDPLLVRPVGELRRAMTSGPSGDTLLLTYDVAGHDGGWRYEVVLAPDAFAERRTRVADGLAHAFGVGPYGSWLAVGDGPVRVAPPAWRRLATTRRAVFDLEMLRPEDADEALYLPTADDGWEYVYRPRGGRTLTFVIDGEAQRPVGWDVMDEMLRLTWCEDARWAVRHGRYVPESVTCGAINGDGDRALHVHLALAGAERLSQPPAWAHPSVAPVEAPCPPGPVQVPIEDELRIELAVGAGGTVVPFVLDSGAWHTYVDADVARALGVVPTGEAPHYVEPPWLPSAESWVGVADRLVVEGVPLDGVRVLVMEDLAAAAGTAGLLGADFFRRFVVDIDTPHRLVRLVPHEDFRPPPSATPLLLHGTLHGAMKVTGEVRGVDRGGLILDTGATSRLVVHSPAMAAVRPRRGNDVGQYYGDMARTPDYLTDVDGLRLGPFAFPPMPAWGRDRERERLGVGIGLVGMGTMRHLRMSFDIRNRTVYATAGAGYQALVRAGVELDDDEQGGALVTWVVPHGAGWARGIRVGDTLTAVEGVAVTDAVEGRRALASHVGANARLTLRREDRDRRITVALDVPADVVDELALPPDRSRLEGPACPGSPRPLDRQAMH